MKRLFILIAVLATGLALVGSIVPAAAQSGNTWRADYFGNTDWAGAPVTTEFVSFASFDWGYGSPSPYVPADNFTARLTTNAFFYAGNYTFSVIADDEFTLIIDGVTRLDSRGKGLSGKPQNITVPMAQGQHHVEVLYREWSVTAYLFVNWTYAGSQSVRPPVQTYPPLPKSSGSVQTKFGNYTACQKQGIHQANCFASDGAWDSPNLGSIQMERPIEAWAKCEPADQVSTFYVSPQVPQKDYRCSKTLAGWFPN